MPRRRAHRIRPSDSLAPARLAPARCAHCGGTLDSEPWKRDRRAPAMWTCRDCGIQGAHWEAGALTSDPWVVSQPGRPRNEIRSTEGIREVILATVPTGMRWVVPALALQNEEGVRLAI